VTVFNAVLPIVTLVLGFFGSVLLEGRRDRQTLERERLARVAQRVEGDRRDRLAFERQSLNAAHEAIRALVEEIHSLIPLIGAAERVGKEWDEYEGGNEAKHRVLAANVRRGHIATLVLDRTASEAIGRVGEVAVPLYMDNESLRSEAMRAAFYEAVDDAFKVIADRLRVLYSTIDDVAMDHQVGSPDREVGRRSD
jgi:hypothetical protein